MELTEFGRSDSHPEVDPAPSLATSRLALATCRSACKGGEEGGTAAVPHTVRGATGLVDGEAKVANAEPFRGSI